MPWAEMLIREIVASADIMPNLLNIMGKIFSFIENGFTKAETVYVIRWCRVKKYSRYNWLDDYVVSIKSK